jgi:hypothetical protein
MAPHSVTANLLAITAQSGVADRRGITRAKLFLVGSGRRLLVHLHGIPDQLLVVPTVALDVADHMERTVVVQKFVQVVLNTFDEAAAMTSNDHLRVDLCYRAIPDIRMPFAIMVSFGEFEALKLSVVSVDGCDVPPTITANAHQAVQDPQHTDAQHILGRVNRAVTTVYENPCLGSVVARQLVVDPNAMLTQLMEGLWV